MGRIKLHEFNQDDDELQTELFCEKSTTWAEKVKQFMRKQMPEILRKHTWKLIDAMKERDMDEQRLAEARAKEKAALEEYKRVDAETGEKKAQIAAERKEKEELMKQQEQLKQASMPQPVNQPKKIEGTGSVWNQNSYHWEEKSVGKWAEEHLKKLLTTYTYVWQEATLKIVDLKTFKGEASVSIRKGKKIVAYDFEIMMKWEIRMVDKEGNEYAKTSGTYEMPELSNEEAPDWELRVQMGHDEQGIQNML